ncbi:MAG: helix-turn-helix domain-containing protein [Bacteroidia bacterium]
METLKYKVITSEKQYDKYCKTLEDLVFKVDKSKQIKEEIALLTLLIEKWDDDHNDFHQINPVELIRSLMNDHNMKAKDLVELLGISKGYVSGILHYKKGLSKEVIRKLAQRFKLSQEAFNRPYKLKSAAAVSLKNSTTIQTHKKQVA